MKIIQLTIALIIGLLLVAAICGFTASVHNKITTLRAQVDRVPTVEELQQRLVNQGYAVEIDGIVGPETLKQWNRYICDQYAIEAFERHGIK